MHIDFKQFLGYINNDTGIQGKAFIFNIIRENKETEECILFVHSTIKPFVTIREELVSDINKEILIETIFKQYPLQDLLEYENK